MLKLLFVLFFILFLGYMLGSIFVSYFMFKNVKEMHIELNDMCNIPPFNQFDSTKKRPLPYLENVLNYYRQQKKQLKTNYGGYSMFVYFILNIVILMIHFFPMLLLLGLSLIPNAYLSNHFYGFVILASASWFQFLQSVVLPIVIGNINSNLNLLIPGRKMKIDCKSFIIRIIIYIISLIAYSLIQYFSVWIALFILFALSITCLLMSYFDFKNYIRQSKYVFLSAKTDLLERFPQK